MNNNVFKILAVVVGGVLALFIFIQLIPIWALKTNPPIIAEPNWDSPQTRTLAERACFDCHSNETKWPWYSNVAPVSWLIVFDTVRGRNHLNFSEWGLARVKLDEVGEVIQEGEMPPVNYVSSHPEAYLTPIEKQQLIDGLSKTIGSSGDSGEESDENENGG